MRFLHTADWHVGKLLRNRSRLDEMEAVLAEMLDICRRERIDCVLVAGDLFDSQAPPPEAERLVYRFFAELLALKITAVVIGGNHDHPKRLAAIRQLLEPMNLFLRPEPQRPDAGGVVDIVRNGETARIACLPFVLERRVVEAAKLMLPESEWAGLYSERLAAMIAALAAGFTPNTINILLSHLYVDKAITSTSEREIHVAQPYAVPPQSLPATAQYVALGHLHRPQELMGQRHWRYSGSPLQLDFGEQGQRKSVVVVEARPGVSAKVEELPLTAGRGLRDISGEWPEVQALAGQTGDDYLRVTVRSPARMEGLSEKVHELFPNALQVANEYPRAAGPAAVETARMSPADLFAAFYLREKGAPPPEPLRKAFLQLHDEVTHASDPA